MSMHYSHIGRSRVKVYDENGVWLGEIIFSNNEWLFVSNTSTLSRIEMRRIYNKMELLERQNKQKKGQQVGVGI